MTLEDFFTLTEIKDGLTAPSRVEELVSAMQKEKDYFVKNVGDASRQWAAVASTIAATKNRDCLDGFMQLDGLQYFDRWLKDAQRLSNDSTDSIIEDSIIALLGAIENLRIESEKSISSGIWHTVENLIGHSSTRVQDLASALCDSWKLDKVKDDPQIDGKNINSSHNHEKRTKTILAGENSKAELSAVDPPLFKLSDKEEMHMAKIREAESLPFTNLEEVKSDRGEDLAPRTGKTGLHSNIILGSPCRGNRNPDGTPCCEMADIVQEHAIMKENCSVDTAFTETISSPHPKQSNVVGSSDATMSGEGFRDAKSEKTEPLVVFSDAVEGPLDAPSSAEPIALSDAVVGSDKEIKTEPLLHKTVDSSEGSRLSSEPKSGTDDVGLANNCSKQVSTVTHQDSKYDSDASPNSSGKDFRHEKPENLGMPSYSDIGTSKGGRSKKKRRVDWRNNSLFSRSATASQGLGMIDGGTADIELDYGIVDALEVATKVAQEVAREVDSGEQSFSSSKTLSSDSSEQLGSPDSTNGEHDNSYTDSPAKEVPLSENHLPETSNEEQNHIVSLNNLDIKGENGISKDMVSSQVTEVAQQEVVSINNDIVSSQVTEMTQQQVVSAEKDFCDFDLNQEVCADDTDHAASSICTPVPVVSASRPAAVSGFPSTPLQFEGALRWKGSAATSAFRAASPRRTSGGANGDNSAKRNQCFLGIDLNVAEGIDDEDLSITSGKQIHVSSSIRSAESSVEVNPGKSERFKLDLNCRDDKAGTPPPSDLRIFLSQSGHQSISSASSSVQHSMKSINIDLNDRPHFHIGSSDQGLYHGQCLWSSANPYEGGNKSDKPVISIFGTKVEVNKKDLLPSSSSSSSSSFLPNGKPLEHAMELNTARTGHPLGLIPTMSYTHAPVYGYNGITTTPGMSFSSPMFVSGSSFPYMMDPRGASPIFPQVIGSAPPVIPTYPQPPFILNMVGGPTGLNGSGPARPGFDLNSGLGADVGNREAMNFRQFLLPGQIRPAEEHSRGNSQGSSSSIVGGKRKEPESGWEPYTLNSRPPWR